MRLDLEDAKLWIHYETTLYHLLDENLFNTFVLSIILVLHSFTTLNGSYFSFATFNYSALLFFACTFYISLPGFDIKSTLMS